MPANLVRSARGGARGHEESEGSTRSKVLRPSTFCPASKLLVFLLTVALGLTGVNRVVAHHDSPRQGVLFPGCAVFYPATPSVVQG
jgi:hypothetical protein